MAFMVALTGTHNILQVCKEATLMLMPALDLNHIFPVFLIIQQLLFS